MARPVGPSRVTRVAAAVLLATGIMAGCGRDVVDDFPLGVGFQPLEPLVAGAACPAASANELHPQGLGVVATGPRDGHYSSHACGYLHAPLAKVYEALHDPAASYIHNDGSGTRTDGPPVFGVEPFPVSFRVRYASPTGIPGLGDARFDVTYRAGPLEGTEAAPIKVGERYQKTWGVKNIEVMSGSLVATEVAPGVTAVEMVAWLKATTQYQSDCNGTVVDLFGGLEAKLASMPP